MSNDWQNGVKLAITICDKEGIITDLNDVAANTFRNYGGRELIGKKLQDCHPEPARTKVEDLLNNQKLNAYTIEKEGKKKLIYQTPYFEKDEFMGLVELSMEIPFEMQHFIRQENINNA